MRNTPSDRSRERSPERTDEHPGTDPVTVSVVIKAYNEEPNIARAIDSAWNALGRLAQVGGLSNGEVILADGGSSDRTVAIAIEHGARVAQLAGGVPRSCGIGPQLGYQYARGDFICLIDGDMALDPDFLPAALRLLQDHPQIAGIGGRVRDVHVVNLEFKRRHLRGAPDLAPGPVDRLNGGGLYRHRAIEDVGYFSDRNLHGYEEYDLAARLRAAGWSLHRLPIPAVDHYGHAIGGYRLLWRRIKTRYVDGIGEMLRAAIGQPHRRLVFADLPEIRLWLGVYLGWLTATAIVIFAPGLTKLALLAGLAGLPILALGWRYRSPALGCYAFVSWSAHAFGMARGFLAPRVPPDSWIESTISGPGGTEVPHAASLSLPPERSRIPAMATSLLAFCIGVAATIGLVNGFASSAGTDDAKWVAVRDRNLAIPEGSPLDFSNLSPQEPAGSRGRVIASLGGSLAFTNEPSRRVPFLCASLAWSPASGSFPDKATADRYAQQLRAHGYNIARFHFADATLMAGRARDFDVDPEQLDRLRYLLAALKRAGIYWMIDGMTSQAGGLGGVEDRWGDSRDLKLAIHVDDGARAHWKRLVETVFGSINPYTGLVPLKDPALALVVLVNENGVEFASILAEKSSGLAYSELLRPGFNAWLAKTYGTTAALRAAWRDLGSGETLEAKTVQLPALRAERGARMRDLQRYFLSLETATFGWMRDEIRALGYPGLVSAYNNWSTTQTDLGRAILPVVTVNAYHDEVPSLDPGTTITQTSSLDDGAEYLRRMIGRRWIDRPFVVTEYDQLFWNRFRHEAGLLVPAYAALQGWDAICRHAAGPIELSFDQTAPHKRAMLPYGISLDPVARAGETLAALLFRRGDVAQAPSLVALPFGTQGDLIDDGQGRLPDSITKIGLLTRFGLSARQGPANPSETTLLPPRAHLTEPDFAKRLASLRQIGIVAPDNPSDEGTGRYRSLDGQIDLDVRDRLLQVVTPHTVAASYVSIKRALRLGPLTIESASGPALLAASALDGQALGSTRRVLLIFATDATNTAMSFSGADHRTVRDFGRLPVLIERQTARLLFAADAPQNWTARSLRLDGSPGEAMAITPREGALALELDNAAPAHGPTTFFLLERVS